MNVPDLDVVTVVNPKTGFVDIRPQEILQVVILGHSQVRWDSHPFGWVKMKLLRHEKFFAEGVERIRQGNFSVASYAENTEVPQHHYWFRLDPDDHLVVNSMHHRLPVGVLRFRSPGELVGVARVRLVATDIDKRKYWSVLGRAVWRERDLVEHEAESMGIHNRHIDEEGGYVLNPGAEEKFRFVCSQRTLLIEVAENCTVRRPSTWKVQTTGATDLGGKTLHVKELKPRLINGTTIQRFEVHNYCHTLAAGRDKMRLGDVRFTLVTDENTYFPKFGKTINLWLYRHRDVDPYYDDDPRDPVDVHVLYPSVYQDPVRPRRSGVTLQDLGTDLLDGVRTSHALPVNRRVKTVIDFLNNTTIEVRPEESLRVVLYKDVTPARDGRTGDWRTTWNSVGVKLECICQDRHRQEFKYGKNLEPMVKGEMLVFENDFRKKQLHVRYL